MTHNGSQPWIIGRNWRPGFTPGGFTEYFNVKPDSRNHGRKHSAVCSFHKEIKEAASVVLEGRQMPRAEEQGQQP